MTHTTDLSPRAQAILRAIKSEAEANRRVEPPAVISYGTAGSPEIPLGESVERLTALVDQVVAHTENIRARVRRIEDSLDALSGALAAPAVSEPELTSPAADPQQAPAGSSHQERLIAIEMAVSGSSRGEVGERLTQEFGVTDPEPILADVFGAHSADSVRMPWRG
jgi:hypothetical protein